MNHLAHYLDRCTALARRGLHPALVDQLRAAGDLALLAQAEAATDAQLQQLNAAWAAREDMAAAMDQVAAQVQQGPTMEALRALADASGASFSEAVTTVRAVCDAYGAVDPLLWQDLGDQA